eukprot:s677_g3.t1
MERKLCTLRKEYVEKVEKTITFGNGKGWQDVEADEATFVKRNIANVLEFQHLVKSKKGTIMWEQWGGIIQRGHPTSLVLRRLTPEVTVLRAPGPGAIRRVEWKALANEFLCDRKDPKFYDAIREDTHNECAKFGKVVHVTVDPRGSAGLIYILYESPQQRLAGELALNDRWITASGIDDEIWQELATQGESAPRLWSQVTPCGPTCKNEIKGPGEAALGPVLQGSVLTLTAGLQEGPRNLSQSFARRPEEKQL